MTESHFDRLLLNVDDVRMPQVSLFSMENYKIANTAMQKQNLKNFDVA